jgi:toxin ParE1/3/4
VSARVVFRPQARAELSEAARWYESKSLVVTVAFRREIRQTISRVVARPKSFPEIAPGIRRALTRQFPYAVFFAEENAAIVILAVKHQAQDPATWP